MGHRIPHVSLAAALGLLLLAALAPAASADFSVCSTGSAAGQCSNPGGVAVDSSNGQLFVADAANNRVDVFESDGTFVRGFGWGVADGTTAALQTCTSSCFKGIAGTGAGQLNNPRDIAVDPVSHAVYVGDRLNNRVQKFDPEGHFAWMVGGKVNQTTNANLCTAEDVEVQHESCGAGEVGGGEGQFFATRLPVAVGPGGNVFVADSKRIGVAESEGFTTRIQEFTPTGTSVAPQLFLPGTVGEVTGIGVDANADLYVAVDPTPAGGGEQGAVRKYDAAGVPVAAWGSGGKAHPSGGIRAIALDAGGDLFVGDFRTPANGFFSELSKYDGPSGAKVGVFYGEGLLEGPPSGLALDGANVFVSQGSGVVQTPLPDPGPLLIPGSALASPVGNVKATLTVSFNPEGKASTVHFEYVDKESFEKEGGFASPNTRITPESDPTPASFETQSASAGNVCLVPTEPTCLKPETTYYFRAVATNADGTVSGDKAEFTTLPPLSIDAIWASEPGSDSIRLNAEVNPLGIHASGHFQFIEEGPDYQANGFLNAERTPGEIDFGSGEAPLARSAQVFPLKAGTTYHYRLIASGSVFPPVTSAEGLFTTFAPPGPEQGNCPNQAFRSGPSAALPDCRAYELVTPLEKNNGDILTGNNPTGYPTNLDQSSIDGSAFTYSSYRAFADPESAPFTNQYLARRDPAAGWQSESLAPPRGPQFRNAELENEFKAFSADLSRSWMLQEGEPTLDSCAPAGFPDLYRRESASGAYRALSCAAPHLAPNAFVPELQGTSADGSHAVFRVNDQLAVTDGPSASGAGNYQVYLASGAGELRLVNVLPGGEASGADSSAGSALLNEEANKHRFQIVKGALSEDGTRVFWSAGGLASARLYLRINADQEQSKVKEGKCTQPTRACTIAVSEPLTPEGVFFQAANPQGTKALFLVGSGALKGNLYRFDAGAQPPASELVAEGIDPGGLGGGGSAKGILGASEDLSRVYYASTQASAQAQGEGAIEGKPNVYLAEGGTPRFIGTLSSTGENSDLARQESSPLAAKPIFRSARVSPDGRSLVFMSNSRALSEAVAGYDNTDALSGEADAEVYLYDAAANGGVGALRCVSCNPSGARPRGREIHNGVNGNPGPYAAATIPLPTTHLFQPRYLSDDGERVFFNSFEALVLADTNGKQDVYRWQEAGSPGCSAQSPSYVPSSEGCLHLISSGQSSEDSELLDASPSGDDVFFTTVEDLLPQDFGLVDIYDARVGGGFPPPPPPPPACEGDACQNPAPPPNDPTPASAAFKGAGNLPPQRSNRCPAGTRKVRKAGGRRCVKPRKAKRAKRNRKHHDRRATR